MSLLALVMYLCAKVIETIEIERKLPEDGGRMKCRETKIQHKLTMI